MEIESLKLDHGDNCHEEISAKQLSPQDAPDVRDIFADPPLIPRVGEDYQVEIPPLRTELLTNPLETEAVDSTSLIGLPIPIMWVHIEARGEEGKWKGKLSKPTDIAKPEGPKENRNFGKNYVRTKKRSAQNNEKDIGETKLNKSKRNKDKCAVPGLSSGPWSDSEVESFVLGLYIFGKNFILIERFIDNRNMGDMLSFYYGGFYRSDAYCRWSARQKTGSRKCIRGRKIFTGWRQQELLSRLLPKVSEESQKTLLKGSMLFSDGKTSLEEYVSSLKSTVGLQILMEAISIGKGKEDLTAFSTEHGKNNHVLPGLPKMPSGKACSSLTCSDIVKFLTGGFRLSKARCNDIFWEAVWPRLLARGWHSEQPKNQSYVISKNCLVFLMPGVKKFSRRKLVKGEHYFDSVSDVLNKVASEPDLLKLEAEDDENGRVPEVNSDPDDVSDHLHYSYLKPRFPSSNNPNSMKFTIVDTSLIQRGQPSTVRELRCLPDSFRANLERMKCSKKIEAAILNESGKSGLSLTDEKHSKNASLVKDSSGIKFMIVDTSLVHRGKSSKVREMRCSPGKFRSAFEISDCSKPKEGNSESDANLKRDDNDERQLHKRKVEVHSTKPKEGNSQPDANLTRDDDDDDNDERQIHKRKVEVHSTKEKEITSKMEKNHVPNIGTSLENKSCFGISDLTKKKDENAHSDMTVNREDNVKEEAASKMENSLVQNSNISHNQSSKKAIKQQFSRRGKSGYSDSAGPLVKRRKLSACAVADSNCTKKYSADVPVYEKAELNGFLNSPNRVDNIALSLSRLQIDPRSEESLSSLGKGSPEEKREESSCSKMDKDRPISSIDLNLPQIPGKNNFIDVDNGRNGADSYLQSNAEKPPPDDLKEFMEVEAGKQCSDIPRRQSTRNRPLTVRALEAFANGFLYVQKKQTKEETCLNKIPLSSPLRKARSRLQVSSKKDDVKKADILQPKEEKERVVSEDARPITLTISNSFDQT